jgi:hypothetical protein
MEKVMNNKEENLYKYILNLSTFEIDTLIENSKSEIEKEFYLKLEELKLQTLQKELLSKEEIYG